MEVKNFKRSGIYQNIVVKVFYHLRTEDGIELGLWCLTALSTIFQLYRGYQFY